MRVGIVGGGITGLTLAYRLREHDIDVTVFEASDRPGGVIWSERVDGRLLEYGPQRIRLTPPIESLVDDLGLREELLTADPDLPLFVYVDGRLRCVPFSLRAFLATDLLSVREKLRFLLEPFTDTGHPDESVAEYFTRKFGSGAARKLIGPLVGGIYASDPAKMPAEHAIGPLLQVERESGSLLRAGLSRSRSRDRPPAITFGDGLARLPEGLAAAIGSDLRLETPVEAIHERDGRYRLRTPDGEPRVDRVVVTVPAPAAADLLEPVAPSAPRLHELAYNPLAIVHLLADPDRDAMGYQVARDTGFETLGVTWNASLFGRAGVHTAFLGGMGRTDVLERSDEELGATAAMDFEAVTGAAAAVLAVTRHPLGFPAHDGSWDALEAVTLPDGITLATNYTGRVGIGGRIREAESLAEQFATPAESERTAAPNSTATPSQSDDPAAPGRMNGSGPG